MCGIFIGRESKTLQTINPNGTPGIKLGSKAVSTTEVEQTLMVEAESDAVEGRNDELPRSSNASFLSTPEMRIPRLINDATLFWNETMDRPWLSFFQHNNITGKHPPFMILLTDVGWNQPDQKLGLRVRRSLRERELIEGIINHPYFHPTAWDQIRNGDMPIFDDTVNYYVFADVQQCIERNYPGYGEAGGRLNNSDTFHNRPPMKATSLRSCYFFENRYKFWEHPLFRDTSGTTNTTNEDKIASARAKLVIFDCRGRGPRCGKHATENRISIAAISGTFPDMKLDRDQGLMPPAVNPVVLSVEEEASIANCQSDAPNDPIRPIKALYLGNFRSGRNQNFTARGNYFALHDPEAGFIFRMQKDVEQWQREQTEIPIRIPTASGVNETTLYALKNVSYGKLMRSTKFAMVPRGDNKFSYRITEALSAGAIPVFHADDYMFPFRPELVDWNKCGIILPEKDAGQPTLDVISRLLSDPTKTCAMRQYCYFEIYKKYAATATKQIDGIVRGLDSLARGPRREQAGFICNETSIANLECNPSR